MRTPSSDLVLGRARRYVAGQSRAAIAEADGVGRARILHGIRRVVQEAAESLPPGSDLPSCAYWRDRQNGTWYVSVNGIPTPADVAWAVDTIALRTSPRPPDLLTAAPVWTRHDIDALLRLLTSIEYHVRTHR